MNTIIPILKSTCSCGKVISIKAEDYNVCDDSSKSTFFADTGGYESECECGLKTSLEAPVAGVGRLIGESDALEIKSLLEHLEISDVPSALGQELVKKLNSIF